MKKINNFLLIIACTYTVINLVFFDINFYLYKKLPAFCGEAGIVTYMLLITALITTTAYCSNYFFKSKPIYLINPICISLALLYIYSYFNDALPEGFKIIGSLMSIWLAFSFGYIFSHLKIFIEASSLTKDRLLKVYSLILIISLFIFVVIFNVLDDVSSWNNDVISIAFGGFLSIPMIEMFDIVYNKAQKKAQ